MLPLGRRRRDDRGAVLVMTALIASVLMVFGAFAVDLGMQRVSRRDMQALADVVALDMAWEVDGIKTIDELALNTPNSDWNQALARSIARNSPSIGATPSVTLEVGYLDPAGDFQPMTLGTDKPTAVRARAASRVEFHLSPTDDGGSTQRWAVAANQDSACFGVGSYAVRLATKDSALLNRMLGDALGTTVLGYDGLVDANVSLLAITAALRAGSPNGVLDPSQVKLGDFVLATATALTNTPGADTADVGLLQAIYAQLDFPNKVVDLGKLVNVGTGNMSAIDATFNVLSLIHGAAIVADGNHLLGVPTLGVTLPSVTNLTARLTVIEAPQFACDTGTAKTSQIALELHGHVNVDLLGALGITLASVTGDISVTFNLANASATLNDVHCTNGAADGVSLNVLDQNLAATTVDFSGLGVKPLGLPTIPLVGLSVSTAQPNPSGVFSLAVPTYYYPSMFATPQVPQPVPHVTSSQLTLLGINLGPTIVTPLLDVVLNPIVDKVNNELTNVVSPLLGLNLAGADLTVLPTPTCTKPRLRG